MNSTRLFILNIHFEEKDNNEKKTEQIQKER